MVEYGLEWSTLTSYFQMVELASVPNTPQANQLRLYALDKAGASALYYKNDAGTVFDLSGVANAVHTTDADWIDLTDGGATTLHSHSGGTMAIGGSITSATAGSVLFAGAAGVLAQDNANFFWDDSTNRLGIGTAAPGVPIDVLTTVTDAIKNRSTAASALSTIVTNTVGNIRIFVPGAANDFITGSASGDAGIRFTDTGRLLFGTSTVIRLLIDSAGFVGIGTTTPPGPLSVLDNGVNNNPLTLTRYGGVTTNPNTGISILAARGTLASPTAVQTDDTLLRIVAQGYGTSFTGNAAAAIRLKAGSAFSGTSHETYITLETVPSGSLTLAERFRVGSAGQWGIGGATFGTSGQVFTSGGSAAAPTWATPAGGANFGPGLPTTITVVNGHVTAIA